MQMLLAIATLVMAALSPLLAWWGSTRYFAGRWEAVQAHTAEWRTLVEKRLEAIDGKLEQSSYMALSNRISLLEADMDRMKTDIGTTDTGMRGQLHRTSTMVLEHDLRLDAMQRKGA